MTPLHRTLEQLAVGPARLARIDNDPVGLVHRYDRPEDQEIAGLLAAGLAYGRVAAFRPKVAELLDRADAHGGPRAWVDRFDPDTEGWLDGFQYRWNRGADHKLLLAGLRDLLAQHGSMGALVQRRPDESDLIPALSRLVHALRASVLALPEGPPSFTAASHGLRYLLPDPAGPSAAKRIHMFARWMVRPADGVDLGTWSHLAPADLVMPLDTHVHRIAVLVGLCERPTADRRAAQEVTANLARFDAVDPVRFDFALAHLGISGGCRGHHVHSICSNCPLQALCSQGQPGPPVASGHRGP